MKPKRGFTLIELLVVIAIIAILAAILFPVFAKAKRASMASVCFQNVKQMSLASVLYSDANNGALCPTLSYPAAAYPSPTFMQNAKLWKGLLKPYYGSRSMVCPALVNHIIYWFPPEAGFSINADMPGTYAMNQELTGWVSGGASKLHFASQYLKVSRMIVFNESIGVIDAGFNLIGDPMKLRQNLRNAPIVHDGKITVGFMDGHAKAMYLYDAVGDSPEDCMMMQFKGNGNGWTWQQMKDWQDNVHKYWPPYYPPKGERN